MADQHTVKTRCRFCRREFDSFGLKKICPECEHGMEDHLVRVKKYIAEFPDATVMQICTALDIPSALIKYFLKEERLEVHLKKGESNYLLTCEKCGKPITSGRYCNACDRSGDGAPNDENTEMENQIAGFHAGYLIKEHTQEKDKQ